ncbi:MAG TPA: radical SAM family heme chaperone HemW [Gemmataceae bacterium]|nr:radical SAM family heme chaperone HemW [Gemmataceae bacterium]
METSRASVPVTVRPPWLWPRAAYVHVPFCAHRCVYCDFAIAVGQDDQIDRYLDALAAELATLAEPQPVQTLFLGGGTPTHLDARRLERLLGLLRHWFLLSPGHEFSVEANPGTLDADKVAVLADHGVNRVSLGAQSFQPELLHRLGRDHTPADVPRAVECVRRRIEQVSLDLIFGVPGQTLHAWRDDLARALALGPDHVSTYGLTYEKGTPLWKQRQRGQVQPLDEEAELALYACAIDTLEAAGFEHYEISNFARPGRRCRHNQVYWANHAYFGFGMGAARYINGRRELNRRDLYGYIRRVLAGESPVLQAEELSPEERARETLALGLRRAEGVERTAFREQTGFELDALAGPAIA